MKTMQHSWKMIRVWLSGRRTIFASFVGTGGYIAYTNSTRNKRMIEQFSTGNILTPCRHNDNETQYMSRPQVEEKLRYILGPEFTNEYYLVKGEVGSGKSRSIVEVVRRMISEEGQKKAGAPVYVLASQGKHFSDTLGKAVHFDFDEHINFKFFLKYILQIDKFPPRDNHNKLMRVLDAIERSSFEFAHKYGRPVVIVIDGANVLTDHFPGALEKLQEKAKLWADTNICKVVFVSNEEETEYILQKSSSCWSRAGAPVHVGSLDQSESIDYLTNKTDHGQHQNSSGISKEQALDIYSKVGGKVHTLTLIKRDHHLHIPFEVTLKRLKQKEMEKILRAAKVPEMWKVVEILNQAPNQTVSLLELVGLSKPEVIEKLAGLDLIRYERSDGQVFVTFESRLTALTLHSAVDKQYGRSDCEHC